MLQIRTGRAGGQMRDAFQLFNGWLWIGTVRYLLLVKQTPSLSRMRLRQQKTPQKDRDCCVFSKTVRTNEVNLSTQIEWQRKKSKLICNYFTPAIFSSISVVSDFGRSRAWPTALSQIRLLNTPMARPTPNITV